MKKTLSFFIVFVALMIANLVQAQLSLPRTIDFEADNSLTGWQLISNNVENETDMGRSTDAAKEGNYGFQFTSLSSADNDDYTQYLISPELASSTHQVEVSFWYRNSEVDVEEHFAVGYSTTTSSVSAFTFEATMVAVDAEWNLYTATLPAGTKYITIRYTADADMYYLYIDDLSIEVMPNCGQVLNLQAINATANSVELTWADPNNTGATYSVRNVTNDTVLATGVAGTTYTVTGLSSNTEYTFTVVANCTNAEASRATSVSVRTSCGDVTSFPYTETFEHGLGCWTTVNAAAEGFPWRSLVADEDNGLVAHSGIGVAMSVSYDDETSESLTPDAWLISPQVVLPQADTIVLSWWFKVNEDYPEEYYSVYVSTDGNTPAQFSTPIDSYLVTDSDTGWVQRSVVLTSYAGQSIYVAFRHHNCYDQWWLLLDDISIEVSNQQPVVTYTVAVNADPLQGSVTGAGTYNEGQSVTLQATPATGYRFVGWVNPQVDPTDTIPTNPYSFVIAANMEFNAVFQSVAGINATALQGVSIRAAHGQIVLCGVEGRKVQVCDISGHTLLMQSTSANQLSMQVPVAGIYLVNIDGQPAYRVLVTK